MTKELAEFLCKVTNECGNQEADLRETYSGRGMYGRETCAVVVDSQCQLISDLVQYMNDNVHGDEEAGEMIWNGGEIPNADGLQWDLMGRGVVIY